MDSNQFNKSMQTIKNYVDKKVANVSTEGEVDLSGLGADLSLNGQTLKLKNSDGTEIGTGVTLPQTTSTIDAYTKTESDARYRNKSTQIVLSDLSSEVISTMTGGTQINATIPDGSIGISKFDKSLYSCSYMYTLNNTTQITHSYILIPIQEGSSAVSFTFEYANFRGLAQFYYNINLSNGIEDVEKVSIATTQSENKKTQIGIWFSVANTVEISNDSSKQYFEIEIYHKDYNNNNTYKIRNLNILINDIFSDYQILSNDSTISTEIVSEPYLPTMQDVKSKASMHDKILSLIHNPFKRLNIALLGDSVTFGQAGSTVVAADYSWAAKLTTYVNNRLLRSYKLRFNKDWVNCNGYLAVDSHGQITLTATNTPGIIATQNDATFKIYCSGFTLNNEIHGYGAKYDVYIDGENKGTVNTSTDATFTISDLNEAEHEIKIIITESTHNATIYLNIINIEFTRLGKVDNRGVSGQQSKALTTRNDLYNANDDLYFIMYGINDRINQTDRYLTISSYIYAINSIRQLNKEALIIIMSPHPLYSNEAEKNLHQDDLNEALRLVASTYNCYFISNYDEFIDYLWYTGKDLDADLLADGLHPNELGYDIYYRNILKHLGLSYKIY